MKKKSFLTTLLLLTACVCTSVLCGCGDDEPEPPKQLVTKIDLSDATLNLQPGEEKRLTITVLPSDASNSAVTWKSSNEGVARVTDGLVSAVALGTCTITCSATDGSGVFAECTVMVEKNTTHEHVDLGLPSGTLWATCNIGASKSEECGYYFAWGETAPKDEYEFGNYKYGIYTDDWKLTKYCTESRYGYDGFTDNITELLPEDDAATVNWGSKWQTPSISQLQELCSGYYTTTTWTTQNGVNGVLVKSKRNEKSIFLPAASYETTYHEQGVSVNIMEYYIEYWSRTLRLDNSMIPEDQEFRITSPSGYPTGGRTSFRWYGKNIRPVRVLAK